MKNNLHIFKIGGNIIENQSELSKFLTLFSKIDGPKILVHGGGKKTNQVLEKMGILPKMTNGRRITDTATLDVAIMVYAGLLNKKIVAELQALQVNAIGMSGADANSIQAKKRPVKGIDFGFVGDINSIKSTTLTQFLNLGLTPVFCALTHDQNGQLLNTNADTIAAELAIGLSGDFKTSLNYCFELCGVLKDTNNNDSLIKQLDLTTYQGLKSQRRISAGMLPKLENCFHALKHGVKAVRIGNLDLFKQESNNFTRIVL